MPIRAAKGGARGIFFDHFEPFLRRSPLSAGDAAISSIRPLSHGEIATTLRVSR
jgi:hypothetical protein